MDQTVEAAVDRVTSLQCEGQTVEVKAARGGTPKLYETLSSFANQTEGGIILCGIDEGKGFAPVGVFDAQKVQRDIVEQCKEMTPELRPTFALAERDGAVIVGAIIEGLPMGRRPAYRTTAGITKGSYIRAGDQDIHMSPQELYEIEAFKNGTRSDRTIPEGSSADLLDNSKTAAFVSAAQKNRMRLSERSQEEVLALTGAVVGGKPTLAGIMTLGDYPQQEYPNLCLTAIAVAGPSISQDEVGNRFLDNKTMDGTIDEIVEDTMAFVARNTKTRSVIMGAIRKDVPQYPERAIREIVTNSLMHRDYGPYNNGTPTRLTIYSDRIECSNPGGIYGGQSVEELGVSNMQTRNPTLVSILEIQGVAENRHSGIPVIRDECERAGLLPPVFEDRRGEFRVTVYGDASTREREGEGEPLSEEAVIAFCRIPRSREEVAEHFDTSKAYVASYYLNPMADRGLLLRTLPDKPRSKNQRYVATRRGQQPG